MCVCVGGGRGFMAFFVTNDFTEAIRTSLEKQLDPNGQLLLDGEDVLVFLSEL